MNLVAALLAAAGGMGRQKVNAPALDGTDIETDPTDASASIVWQADGDILDNGLLFDQWKLFGAGSDYELFVSGTGDVPGGTGVLNSWQNMGTDLGYAFSQTSPGEKEFTGTYQIRIAASGIIIATNTLHVRAEVVV